MDKKSAIVQMYYGLRGQVDSLRNSQEETMILEKIIIQEEAFRKMLTPEQLKAYEKTKSLFDDLSAEESDCCFVEGFRFGVLMGMDILKE